MASGVERWREKQRIAFGKQEHSGIDQPTLNELFAWNSLFGLRRSVGIMQDQGVAASICNKMRCRLTSIVKGGT
jgi:hypothetical protein